jgi:hypothetical protein
MDKLQKLKQEMYDIAIKTYSAIPEKNEEIKWTLISTILNDSITTFNVTSSITLYAKEEASADCYKYHKKSLAHSLADAIIEKSIIQHELVPKEDHGHLKDWALWEERTKSTVWVLK